MTAPTGTVIQKALAKPVRPRPSTDLRVLLVEADKDDAVLIEALLNTKQEPRFAVDRCQQTADAIDALANGTYHVCLASHRIGTVAGIDFISAATRTSPLVP
ncbi:MAG: hypothetical protein AAFV29_04235, partial [Myxococcota bacterium]